MTVMGPKSPYPYLGGDATACPYTDQQMRTERKREQDRAYEQRRVARVKADPLLEERRRQTWRDKGKKRTEKARNCPELRQKMNARARVRNRVSIQHKWPKPGFFLCSECPKPAQEYHHGDYSLWWSVEPLCKACHGKRHQVN